MTIERDTYFSHKAEKAVNRISEELIKVSKYLNQFIIAIFKRHHLKEAKFCLAQKFKKNKTKQNKKKKTAYQFSDKDY